MNDTTKKDISTHQFAWYIFLFAILIIPLLASLVVGIATSQLSLENETFSFIILAIIDLVVVWLSIKYYVAYALKKYNVTNKEELTKEVVVTYVAWSILGAVIYYFIEKSDWLVVVELVVQIVVGTIVTYLAMRKSLDV